MKIIWFAVIGLWIAAAFGFAGYLGRRKKLGPLLQGIACTVLFIAVLLAAWWGVLRAVGVINP